MAADRRFEVGWWGEGLDKAVDYLNSNAAPSARVFGVRNATCVAPTHLAWLRGDLWEPQVVSVELAEWILWYSPTSKACPIPNHAELAYEVNVRGAPLARVYRIR